jgi:2-dehydro-3-deoxygalactonokinase
MSEDSELIGIDWGTTRLRAFRIDCDGRMLERRANGRGVGVIGDGQFDEALEAIIDGWPSGVPILMCGMVGSRQGWREVPYQPCPVHATDLASHLCPVETRHGRSWIVGGVRTIDARMLYDVMRGEETQIAGASTGCGNELMITPGTHSKWTDVYGERIVGFRTYMTGEIYALLEKHSILGRLMEGGAAPLHHEASFLDGVRLGFEDSALLHSLFSVRTQGLFAQRAPAMLASYLSGILIGSEVSAEARFRDLASPMTVIASAALGRLYQAALSAVGCGDVRFVDADAAAVHGLWRIWGLRGRTV